MALLPQLKLTAPKRSNFDLSYINRFTAAPGVLYPAMVQRCLPGDHFEISISHLVKTMPLKAPLMGSMLLKFDLFFVPDRLFIPQFRNNNLDGFGYADVSNEIAFPYFSFLPNTDGVDFEVGKGGIFDFLGIPPGFAELHSVEAEGYSENAIKFNAMPLLGYYSIFSNYYVNPQESNFYWYNVVGNSSLPKIVEDSVSGLQADLSVVSNSDSAVCIEGYGQNVDLFTLQKLFSAQAVDAPMNGLCLRCYQPDYFTNFINTNIYNRLNTTGGGVVNVVNGKYSVNQFRLANKLQKLAERAIIAGNRYGEYIRAMFGVRTDDKLDIPEYLGGFTSSIDFQDIVNQARPSDATSASSDTFTALGSSGGRGIRADKSGKFYINTTEYGNLMCIFSIVPRPDYFQGVKKDLTKVFLSDEFNPQLDRLGWQPLFLSEYYALPTIDSGGGQLNDWNADNPFEKVVAYQPAWLEYMTRTNELHGEFVDTLNYWAIGRSFDRDPQPSDIGTANPVPRINYVQPSAYIFPTDYNVSFVDNRVDAQNFMVQVAFDIFAKRPISKKLMPNLG